MIGLYAATLVVPGGAVGLVAGLRGWTAVAVAPLLTYAIAGLTGPLLSVLGLSWSPASFAIATIVVAVLAGGARFLLRRSRGPRGAALPRWSPTAHGGVVVAVLVATAVGVAALLGGIKDLGAIPQDWDAVFHANGIRYVAETGDGGLYAMARTNWFEGNVALYYPNAYHLVAVVVYRLCGATAPTILNAGSVLTTGMLAVGLVALVRRFGGRPVTAAAAALAGAAMTSLYDMLWHGPLLPFAAGVVLLPAAVVVVRDLLDAPGLRAKIGPAAVVVASLAALMCLHPSVLVSAVLMTAPMLVQRWWSAPRLIAADVAVLAVAGIAAAALCAQEVAGALSTGGNYEKLDRAPVLTFQAAVGQLVTFGHQADTVQLVLAAFLVVGLAGFRRLTDLRWIVGSAALFGVLFVLMASSANRTVALVGSIWWNDSWRPVALAAVPLALVVGNGVAQLQVLAAGALQRVGPRSVVGFVTAAAAIAVFGVATHGLYLGRNQVRLENDSGNGPAVSHEEIAGMQAVARIVPAGERVLNDRGDGSAWMYALTGLRPVAAHYDGGRIGPAAALLGDRFNQYPTDPAVRAAVAQLGIHYVQVDAGFLRPTSTRQAGLTGLDGQPWLRVVYRNPDVVLYEIMPAAANPREPAP